MRSGPTRIAVRRHAARPDRALLLLELTVANLPEDELGQGYEYLIKKFADDSGHTAAEFYTNRTVVHLMTEMLEPQPGESIYDPTCGSGGMLLSCITHLRRQKKEWRNVRLYGQERNLMTSSIARMNCFLHGIEDFQIERGDTPGRAEAGRGRPAPCASMWCWPIRPTPSSSGIAMPFRLRSLGTQSVRHAAAGPGGLRLLAAHPPEPQSKDRPLRDSLSARCALPAGRGRDAAQAHRG
jgi:hypothetical protein